RGGVIVWGVDEGGTPTGLKDAAVRARELNDFLIRHLNPRPLLSVSVTETKNAQLVVVDIPTGADRPYSFRREIFVRVGAKTLRASDDLSADIVERSAARLDRWEREPMPGFAIEDCDENEFEQARTEITQAGRFGADVPRSDQELL